MGRAKYGFQVAKTSAVSFVADGVGDSNELCVPWNRSCSTREGHGSLYTLQNQCLLSVGGKRVRSLLGNSPPVFAGIGCIGRNWGPGSRVDVALVASRHHKSRGLGDNTVALPIVIERQRERRFRRQVVAVEAGVYIPLDTRRRMKRLSQQLGTSMGDKYRGESLVSAG